MPTGSWRVSIRVEEESGSCGKKLSAKRFEFALEKGLSSSGARNRGTGRTDAERNSLDDSGDLIGLDTQIEALKKGRIPRFIPTGEIEHVFTSHEAK